jgi:hypothetical protein
MRSVSNFNGSSWRDPSIVAAQPSYSVIVVILYSLQFDGIFRALQYTCAASDTALAMVKVDHSRFIIRRPAANRAYIVALPDAFAFLRVKVYFKIAQVPGEFQLVF